MKKILVVFICLVAIGVSFRTLRESLFNVPYDAPILGSPEQARTTPSPLTFAAPPLAVKEGPAPRLWPWQEKAVTATDFVALAHEAQPAADAGNGDAQFALYMLYGYCREGMRKRSPAERAHLPAEILAQARARCDPLAVEHPDFAREADRWLAKALESKFPRALAFAAVDDLNAMLRKPPTRAERDRRIAAARARMLEALKSNDPAVTVIVPVFLPLFFPNEPRVERAQWTWRLAACKQGLDCRPGANFVREDCQVRNLCMNGENGVDYILRVADFPTLSSRASELAIKLRKGEIDDKSFDEVVTSLPAPPPPVVRKPSSQPSKIVPARALP